MIAFVLKLVGVLLSIFLTCSAIISWEKRLGLKTNFILLLLQIFSTFGLGKTVKSYRSMETPPSKTPLAVHTVENISVPASSDSGTSPSPIPVRLYYPKIWDGKSALATIILFHGGGFYAGSVNAYDDVARIIANEASVLVASVEYRLAPENPFPAAPSDCINATKYLIANASLHHINPQRVAVLGDSAGGNLAAVVAIQLAQEKIPIRAQILIYPVVDMFAALNSRYASYTDKSTKILSLDKMIFCIRHYLPNWKDGEDMRASPLFATDEQLRAVAPVHFIASEIDVLVDEGKAYCDRLQRLGVKVSYKSFLAAHGAWNAPPLNGCAEMRKESVAMIRSALFS